ncbi:MAG: glycosyltransferase, partial [Spirochaetales bacterium]|nr:glycosyltransferase [Spirochaetales bacterium]
MLRILTFWINGFIHFYKTIKTYQPDIIIMDIDTWIFSLPLLFLARHKRPVMMIDFRSPNYDVDENVFSPKDMFNRFLTWICCKYTGKFLSGLTVITDHFKKFLAKRYKFPLSKIGVWTSGVNIHEFTYKEKSLPAFKLFTDKFILMQHGIISNDYSRGLAETIKALSLLDSPGIILVHFGSGLFRAKEKLMELAKNLGVSDNVLFLDPVDPSEVPYYISRCDCGILAYPDTEYWNCNNPIKLLEYLACGKPVIVSDIESFRSVLGDCESAFYIKDNSPENIASCLRQIMAMRKQLPSVQDKSREIVTQSYTWEAQAEKLLNFIIPECR